jgi:hypothetical protein
MSTSLLKLNAAFRPITFSFNINCLAISYSRNGSASLTAKASRSPVSLGRVRQTRAWMRTPGPRTGSLDLYIRKKTQKLVNLEIFPSEYLKEWNVRWFYLQVERKKEWHGHVKQVSFSTDELWFPKRISKLTVQSNVSAHHFLPHNWHGTSFMLLKGAYRWWYGTDGKTRKQWHHQIQTQYSVVIRSFTYRDNKS